MTLPQAAMKHPLAQGSRRPTIVVLVCIPFLATVCGCGEAGSQQQRYEKAARAFAVVLAPIPAAANVNMAEFEKAMSGSEEARHRFEPACSDGDRARLSYTKLIECSERLEEAQAESNRLFHHMKNPGTASAKNMNRLIARVPEIVGHAQESYQEAMAAIEAGN